MSVSRRWSGGPATWMVAEDEVMWCKEQCTVLLMTSPMQAHVLDLGLLRYTCRSSHHELGLCGRRSG